MKIIKAITYIILALSFLNITYAQNGKRPPGCLLGACNQECAINGCETVYTLVSMEKIAGSFDCDSKKTTVLCSEIVAVHRPDQVGRSEVNVFCKPLHNGDCPEARECITNKFKEHRNGSIISAITILDNIKFDKSEPASLKKLTKSQAKTLIKAINEIDEDLLKNLPSKQISQIEEFRSLSEEQQIDSIIKPKNYATVGIAAASAVGLYMTYRAATAFADDYFGHLRLREKNNKIDDKQFDLKD